MDFVGADFSEDGSINSILPDFSSVTGVVGADFSDEEDCLIATPLGDFSETAFAVDAAVMGSTNSTACPDLSGDTSFVGVDFSDIGSMNSTTLSDSAPIRFSGAASVTGSKNCTSPSGFPFLEADFSEDCIRLSEANASDFSVLIFAVSPSLVEIASEAEDCCISFSDRKPSCFSESEVDVSLRISRRVEFDLLAFLRLLFFSLLFFPSGLKLTSSITLVVSSTRAEFFVSKY